MTGARTRGFLGLGTVLVGAAGATRVLWRAGQALPHPVDVDGPALGRWLLDTAAADPLGLLTAAARLGGLALGAYLVVATAVGVLVRLAGSATALRRAADRFTAPPLRRLLDGALGGGVAVSVALGAWAAPASADGPATPTTTTTASVAPLPALRRGATAPARAPSSLPLLRRLPAELPTTTTEPPTSTTELPVLDPVTVPEPATPTTTTTTTTTAEVPATSTSTPAAPAPRPIEPTLDAPSAPAAPAPVPAAPPATAGTVVVGPGDSFWRIAVRLAAAEGPATDEEVDARWRALVAANRDRLRHPDQPDLLFAGQVLVVP